MNEAIYNIQKCGYFLKKMALVPDSKDIQGLTSIDIESL